MRTNDLQLLKKIWNPSGLWRLVPLAKGYFDIHFSLEDDKRNAWAGDTCSLGGCGVFRFYQWQPDFDPYALAVQSHSQVWIRMYGLSQEYWDPRTLMEIACGVGTLLQLDRATCDGLFGHYARVLFEVDLSDIPSSILVQCEGHNFQLESTMRIFPPV